MGSTKVVGINGIIYDAWQWDGLDVKTLDLPDFLQKVVRAYTFGPNALSDYTRRSGARLYLRTIGPPSYDVMLWPSDWALVQRTTRAGEVLSMPNSDFNNLMKSK